MTTTKELLAQLNGLRIENGKAELANWKAGMPKLEAAIETEQQAIAKRMADEGEGLHEDDKPVSQADAPSDLSDVEVGQSDEAEERVEGDGVLSVEEATKLLTPIPRGAIGAMSIELLSGTDLPYDEIVARIKAEYPAAKTTARSLASVAMDLRRDGVDVPSRRKPAKAKPAKTTEAAGE